MFVLNWLGFGSQRVPFKEASPAAALATAKRVLSGALLHGNVRDFFLVPVECGMAICEDPLRGGIVRLHSWVRHSSPYPFVLTLAEKDEFSVSFTAIVSVHGVPGGGWDQIDVDQSFSGTFTLDDGSASGVWTRSERRASVGTSETLNTSGVFSLVLTGSALLLGEHDVWNPRLHRRFRNIPNWQQFVLTVLLCHHRKDCHMHLVPKDVVYIIISFCAPAMSEVSNIIDRLIIGSGEEFPRSRSDLLQVLKAPIRGFPF